MRAILAAALVACARAATGGEPPAAPPLTLAAAVETALRENPELRSLRDKAGAMEERPAQERALPNPMFQYGGMDRSEGGEWPNTGEKRFMLLQEFPGPGKRDLRERVAAKDAEAMQREVEAMEREVGMKVKESYHDLRAVRRALAIARDERDVLRRMEQVAQAMYAAGSRAQKDVLAAQSESTMLAQKILESEAEENTLKSRLNTLMNLRADAPLGEASTAPADEVRGGADAWLALAERTRPELKGARAQVERYEIERRLMGKEKQPDYRFGVEYRSFARDDDMVMLIAGVDLPIRRAKYQAAEREAGKMAESRRSALEAAQRQVADDVWDAQFRLGTARRSLALYRTQLIPQAEARFQASEAGYRAGKTDFLELLESERFLLNVRVMEAMAEGNLGAQLARLERAVGTDLEAGAAADGGKP